VFAVFVVWILVMGLGSLGGKDEGIKLMIGLSTATIVIGFLLAFGDYNAFLGEVGPLLVVGGFTALVTGIWFSKLPDKKTKS